MAIVWKFTKFVLILIFVGLASWAVVANYSVIFSETIVGEITGVERVELPVALMGRAQDDVTSKMFSYAVGIKDPKSGEIHTASSEDRQWAVAERGQCAEAIFLPYPPWNFQKKGTYFGARLIRLFECPK